MNNNYYIDHEITDKSDYNIFFKLCKKYNLSGDIQWYVYDSEENVIDKNDTSYDIDLMEYQDIIDVDDINSIISQSQYQDKYLDKKNVKYQGTLPSITKKNKWAKSNFEWFFRIDSDTTIFDVINSPRIVLVLDELSQVKYKKYREELKLNNQIYREGATNCLLTPIINWFKKKEKLFNNSSSKRRYTTLIKKTNSLLSKFKNGVPEKNIQEICDILNINISINDIFDNPFKLFKTDKSLTTFKFINNISNHVENYQNKKVKKLTEIQLKELYKKLTSANIPFYYGYNSRKQSYTFINVYNTKYILYNSTKRVHQLLNDKLGIDKFKINIKSKLGKFIDKGVHITQSITFDDHIKDGINIDDRFNNVHISKYEEVDQIQSYIQYENCEYYRGFPSIFNEFVKLNIEYNQLRKMLKNNELYNGYYLISNLDLSNSHKVIRKSDVYYNNNVYPLPEIEFMIDNNIKFNIIAGAWSYKSIDINPETIKNHYSNEEFQKRFQEENKSTIDSVYSIHGRQNTSYAHYCGWLGRKEEYSYLYTSCDLNMANMLKKKYNTLSYNTKTKQAVLRIRKKSHYNNSPIFGFITAYSRISMLMQAMRFPFDSILRIVMDGVYLKKVNKEKLNHTFRIKEKSRIPWSSGQLLISDEVNLNKLKYLNKFNKINNYQYISYTGPGGTGKTYTALKEYPNAVYLAPGYKLSRKKYNEYKGNIKTNVYAKFIQDYNNNKFIIHPKILICDEITMMGDSTINSLIKLFPYTKLIFVGDFELIDNKIICFQTTPMDNSKLENLINIPIRNFTKNYRCTDRLLLTILNNLRRVIIDGKSIQFAMELINKYFKKISIRNLKKIYKKEDMIICCTKNRIKYFNAIFKNVEKYYYIKSDKEHSRGDIVYEKINNKCIKQNAFTAHSVQGETIDNIIIDFRDVFELQIIYTAISRARKYNDISIIM